MLASDIYYSTKYLHVGFFIIQAVLAGNLLRENFPGF